MSENPSAKANVLVVDDIPTNLRLLVDILESFDFEVSVATNGQRAIDIARATLPELILLDISMPEMDGYEACRRLKQDPATRAIPVVFLSGHDDVFDKVKAFEVGAADYVTKPFHNEEVVARVEIQLKIARLQRELERQNAELSRKNAELLESRKRVDLVFSALSKILPGAVLDGKYRLDTRIGGGGFGAVYRATQLSLDAPVAVKVFQPTPGNLRIESLDRFRLEGISACRVAHPNAVAVFDAGLSEEGIAYLVMELLEGCTLAEALRERPILPPARCAAVMIPVCHALAAAHAAGVIHRDVKPENIFLHRTAEGEVVKVLDFGTAKLLAGAEAADGLTLTGYIVGTPAYTAPERLRGHAYDGRSDVYSVAVLLYRLLCGRVPFEAEEPYVLALMHLSEPAVPLRARNPKVPAEVERIVMQGLAKDPSRRPTASELAEALAAVFPEYTAEPLFGDADVRDDERITDRSPQVDPEP